MTREEAITLLDDLIGLVEDNHGRDYDRAFHMAIEALQQGPVKHGKWEEKETHLNENDCSITEWQSAKCSNCGKYHTTPYMYYFNNFTYCPNCGADMRGEQDD